MDIRVDRDLPVPVKTQIAGQVEYAICYGELPPGGRLPRVHELAEALQVSPVTVSHAYADLRRRGLVHSRRGLGTFVTDEARRQTVPSGAMTALAGQLRRIRVMAHALGVDRTHLHQMLDAAFQRPDPNVALELAHVGVFKATTATYAVLVAEQLGLGDRIDAWAIDELAPPPAGRKHLARYEAVLCLPNVVPRVRDLVDPQVAVIDVPVVPSAATSRRIAAIETGAAVGVVAAFPEFLPIIKRGVRALAPGIRIAGACIDDPDEVTRLASHCDLLIVASGCVLPPLDVPAIEFLHAPDPGYVREILAPRLALLRAERTGSVDGGRVAGAATARRLRSMG